MPPAKGRNARQTSTPSRADIGADPELALQIHRELERLGSRTNMNYVCVIGGVNQNPQVKKLRGCGILVAAPALAGPDEPRSCELGEPNS